MKKKKVEIKLKKREKERLHQFIKKGTAKAREITRARVLLLSNSGKKSTLILETLGTTIKTIQNIKERYLDGGIDRALYDAPRSGQPSKFEGKHRAQITALACTEAPEGYAKWSLSLLADKAVEIGIVDGISRAQVGRILKKTK
jgi:putative transposase